MATDTARSSSSGQLWQVPMFMVGLSAIAALPWTKHYWNPEDPPAIERQLRAARAALDAKEPDFTQAIQRGQRVLSYENRYPQFAGTAHFVIGSAHLRLGDDPNTTDAASERQLARQHLEMAERSGVSEADKAKLNYRLGKAWQLSGADVTQTLAALTKSVAAADDPAEAYGLIAQAHLRKQPPDLAAALEASKEQLAKAMPTSDPKLLNQARFRLGELYLGVKNTKDGRLFLSKIENDALPEQFYAARRLLAQSYEETQEWSAAARNWDQARKDPTLNPNQKNRILYRLGKCYSQDQNVQKAQAIWEEVVKGQGEESVAAALKLAELKFDKDPKAAADTIAKALKEVGSAEGYRNSLVSVEEARGILEKLSQAGRDISDAAVSQTLNEAYARIALPGRDDELEGQSADSAGLAALEQIKSAPDKAAELEKTARAQFSRAAEAYERAARKVQPGPDQARWLWNSADRYLKAQQLTNARDILGRLTQMDGVLGEESLAEAWFKIAQTHQQLQQFEAARAAYKRGLKADGPYLFRSRHELALLDLREGKYEEAEASLQENMKSIRATAQPDAALQESTLFALAEVAFQKQTAVPRDELRDYATAEQRLLGAIAQYPDGVSAVRARMMLARCSWFNAVIKSRALTSSSLSDDERKQYQKQYAEHLAKALEQYEKVEMLLSLKQGSGTISSDEAVVFKHAQFWGTDCYFYLRKYDEAIRRYQALAQRYQNQPEELIALSQLWQCYSYIGENEKVSGTIARIREAVNKVPEDAWNGAAATHKKAYWTKWLEDVSKSAS